MKNQIYVPVNGEAEIVREIFNRYVGGETLKQIADDFTVRQIVYYKEKTLGAKTASSVLLRTLIISETMNIRELLNLICLDGLSS